MLLFLGFSQGKHQFPYVLDGFGVIFLGFFTKKHSLVLDFPSGKHCFSYILDGFGVIPLGFPREDLHLLAQNVRCLRFLSGQRLFYHRARTACDCLWFSQEKPTILRAKSTPPCVFPGNKPFAVHFRLCFFLLLGLTQEKHYSACILDGFGVIFLSSCQEN